MSNKCNWELFELRLAIFQRGLKISTTGNFIGEASWEFFNVWVDVKSLGIGDFQATSNDSCNFEIVFRNLIKQKKIRCGFLTQNIAANKLNFDNLRAAEHNKLTLRAAKLYVIERRYGDYTGNVMGAGVLLENVTVSNTKAEKNGYFAELNGGAANAVNF